MNEEIMNEIQPVRPKDQFPFSCRQCGACCRNIEGCVMVESLDAYRLARYLRTKGELIEGIEDFLFRYCDPEPLTEEGFPIYMLKTKAPNGSCIFLMRKIPLGNLNSNNPIKTSVKKYHASVARQSSRERNRLLACKSFAFIHANVHKHCRHFRRG